MDRGESLRSSASAELPDLPQSDCSAHLWGNVKKMKAYKSLSKEERARLKKHYDAAVSALLKPLCDTELAAIKAISEAIYAYLTEANTSKERWTAAHFSGNRDGRTTTQAAESINAALTNQRGFLPPNMLDGCLGWVLKLHKDRKDAADKFVSKHGRDALTPKNKMKHDKAVARANARKSARPNILRSSTAANSTGVVESWSQPGVTYAVQIADLTKPSCCGYSQETGCPCCHQILLAWDLGVDPLTLYDDSRRAGNWADQYSFAPAAHLPTLAEQEPMSRSLGHTKVPIPPGRPKKGKRVASAMDPDSTSGRAPCAKCGSWSHVTSKCFQCVRCYCWGHKAPTCREALPPGHAYIAQLLRPQRPEVHPWNANKKAGVKKEKA